MWNNKYKWVFVHPQKCGGCSIEQLLREHYSYDECLMSFENQHYNISRYINLIEGNIEDYFVFGCIRNPWDRMVSLFHHAVKHDKYQGSFDQYIQQKGLYKQDKISLQAEFKFKHNGKNLMDYVAKLENFNEDVGVLMQKLNIDSYTLPRINHNTNRPKIPYQEYYSDQSRNMIENIFRWDIETFGYSFE